MAFWKDMRSVHLNDAGFVANFINAAGAVSQLRLQTLIENVKPLQQAFNNRYYGPIIVGGLATGAMLYMGHRWIRATGGNHKDQDMQFKLVVNEGKNEDAVVSRSEVERNNDDDNLNGDEQKVELPNFQDVE